MFSSHARVSATVKSEFASVEGLQVVKFAPEISVKRILHHYRQDPNVLYAEPNYLVHATTLPNDPMFPLQWGLLNTGQDGGTSGADIHAQQAWNVTTGSQNVVVAVIDSGIDYTHPDLAANIWSAPTAFTQTINGVTVNCAAGTHGFNAVSGNCDPMDDFFHGTHVAGIIGAAGNNGLGVSGVNWNVSMLACKFLDATGSGSAGDALTCLDYVRALKEQGVNIVATNNSWGGNSYSQSLNDAITALQQDGILFIAAAGNDFSDNDVVSVYPANDFVPNVISVAATNRFDLLPAFTNLGRHSVHLGAPGQEVLSTLPGSEYGVEAGTSMAAPFVTGVAALLAAQDSKRDWRAIKNLILAGGDSIPELAETITGKRLDAYGSMTCLNSTTAERLQPSLDSVPAAPGQPLALAELNINCGQPAGPVQVTVTPGGQTINLVDDGTARDQASGDGVYTGQWTPSGLGNYTLTFSDGESVQATALSNYTAGQTNSSYQTITGTNLNLGDDDVASVTSPFPIDFGGGQFSTLYVSSNGTISFTNAFGDYTNGYLPLNLMQAVNPMNPPPLPIDQPVVSLLAPFWTDLYPVKGTDQNVFWEVIGAAPNRQLVIEWRDVRAFECYSDSSATVTFQVVFTEGSSDFWFNYANVIFGGACSDQNYGAMATIGMEITQNVGTAWSMDQTAVGNNMSLLWSIPSANAAPNPVPSLTSVSPASVPMGSGDTIITLTGAGFVPDSQVVVYAGGRLLATYASDTELQALVPASLLVNAIPLQINVVNPPPGGGTSPGVSLAVVAPASSITSISPISTPVGSFDLTLTVNGAKFYSGSVINFNGYHLPTKFINSNQLSAALGGSLLANAGTVAVTVFNGGGVNSNALTFTITAQSSSGAITAPRQSAPPGSPNQPPATGPEGPQLPGHFPGWKVAAKLGSDYLARFARRRAGLASSATLSSSLGGSLTHSSTAPSPPPGFNFRPALPAGFIPTAVVTGDFNGDGHVDWAVANGGDSNIWIYLGKGDGTAQLPTIIPLKGLSPTALAAADMNHDGKLDLIVAEADSGSVGLLLGNGDGTFGPEREFYVLGVPESLAVADFDGDGYLDVVVGMALATSELAFFPGDGKGMLGAPTFHFFTSATLDTFYLAVADLNGDGLPDIVALNYFVAGMAGTNLVDQTAAGGARVYLNAGNGQFKEYQQFYFDSSTVSATALALGDVDGDGCADAVVFDSEAIATLFPGKCDGSFDTANTRIFGAGILAAAASLVDLNGDGKLDLVSSAFQVITTGLHDPLTLGNCLSVQFGDGAGNFSAPTLFRGEYGMYSIGIADLNGDGHLDVVSANQETDSASVYLNNGQGGFGGPMGGYVGYLTGGQTHAVFNAPSSNFLYADVNHDGIKDLALLESAAQFPQPIQLTVLLGDGAGKFGSPNRFPLLSSGNLPRVFDYGLADVRGTGIPDLVMLATEDNPGTGILLVYAKNNGDGTFQAPVVTPLSTMCPINFVTGDFNNDGKLDLMTVNLTPCSGGTYTYSLVPLLGNGDGTFKQGSAVALNGTGFSAVNGMLALDVNGDGKLDLLAWDNAWTFSSDLNAIYELLGNGDGTFQAPKLLFSNPGSTSYFATADLNHDGIPDLVEEAFDSSGLVTYRTFLGQPGGTFQLAGTYGPFVTTHSPYVSDFSLLYGAPDKPLWPQEPTLGDLNGDGKIDVLAYLTGASGAVGGGMVVSGVWSDTALGILAGNGDGTLTPSNLAFNIGDLLAPQLAVQVNGSPSAGLIELDSYSSSYNVIAPQPGDSFRLALVSSPVLGANGSLQVTLAFSSAASTTIQLSASDPNISIPASVTIPAGAAVQSVPFQIGGGFNPAHVFALNGQIGSETHSAYGTQATSTQGIGFVVAPADSQGYFSPVVVVPSQPGTFEFYVVSLGGYSTQIQASCQELPATAACQLNPTPIDLGPGSLAMVSLTVTTALSAPQGIYTPTVVFTDGTLTQKVSIPITIGDFSIGLTPASQTVPQTGTATYNFSLTGTNGYLGPVQVSFSGLPAGATGELYPTQNTNPSPLPFDIQTQNVAPGSYPFTLTGTAGSLTHSATATLVVLGARDFTGSITPVEATATAAQPANFNITLNSVGGETGSVTLQCSNLPSGATCSFNPPASTLPANGSVSDTLTIQVNSSVAAGTYPFTVVATCGSVTHNIPATLVVQASPGFSGSISPTSATLSAGQSANFAISLNSLSGATGTVNLQCLNVPSGTVCAFNPAAPVLPANGKVSDQLTVQVNSKPAAVPPYVPSPWMLLGGGSFTVWFLAILAGALAAWMELRQRKQGPALTVAALVGLTMLLLTSTSCGGGGSSNPPPNSPAPVTFSITVQASGAGVSGTKTIGTLTITVN